jgi:hypothetical protein
MASDALELSDLPPELQGALPDLGRFRAEYRAGWRVSMYLVFGMVLLVLGPVLAALILFVTFQGIVRAHSLFHLVLWPVAISVTGGRMLFRATRAWGVRILVFERCLVHSKGGMLRVFGWAEIASFQHKAVPSAFRKAATRSYWMTLRRTDGVELTIDDLVDRAKELGDGIEVELAKRQLTS